jgi:hypothetical protein
MPPASDAAGCSCTSKVADVRPRGAVGLFLPRFRRYADGVPYAEGFGMKHGTCILLGLAVSAVLWAGAPAQATTTITHPYQGVTYITDSETAPRAVTMHIIQVDLTAPGLSFEITPQVTPTLATRDTTRQTTLNFLNATGAQAAINGNFFVPYPSSDTTANVVGLAASLGNVYSPFEAQPVPGEAGFPDQSYAIVQYAPALNIDASNHASIVHRDPAFADNKHTLENVTLYNAFSGSAQIITGGTRTIPTYNGAANGGLNTNGTYNDGNSWYNVANARTIIGLSADAHTLTLFTVDKMGSSLGLTVGEAADLLINNYGVANALNLDGGGSTSMALRDPVSQVGSLVNTSADSTLGRSVGDSFAIFAAPIPEPTTLAVLGLGALLTLRTRRRSRG